MSRALARAAVTLSTMGCAMAICCVGGNGSGYFSMLTAIKKTRDGPPVPATGCVRLRMRACVCYLLNWSLAERNV